MSSLTSRQFAEWIAEYNLTPFGQDVSDRVTADTAAMLWNQRRGRGVDPIDGEYFLPKSAHQQSVEEMKYAIKRYIG